MAAAALALSLFASLVYAKTTVSTGQTVNWSGQGANSSGIADTCDNNEWLFVLNGIAASSSSDVPQQISVTFTNGSSVSFPLTSLQGQLKNNAGNAHYSIAVTSSNASLGIRSASFVVPSGMTEYNQFVLSHGGACPSVTPPQQPPPPPPPPGQTPEPGTLALFGAGLIAAAGYGVARRRGRR